MELIIELDYLPISVNCAYRSGGKHVYKSKQYTEMAICWQNILNSYKHLKISGLIDIDLIFTKKRKNKYDVDNLLKFTLDMLHTSDVIDDDSNVISIKAKKQYGDNDHTKIVIRSVIL